MKLFATILLLLTLSFPVFAQSPCNDVTSITYQGYEYDIVEIGEQCWFAENCRHLPEVSPSNEGSETEPHYYVYDYEGTDVDVASSTENYEIYGVLYNWPAVMTEDICPSGWHIPSDEEFTQLTDFLGGESVAGGKMKEAGYDHWISPNTGATNSSGWSGIPGGIRYSSSSITYLGVIGYWWSSSETGNNSNSWYRRLDYDLEHILHHDGTREDGRSARCVTTQLIVQILGCTDPTASNYDPEATEDDGSCCYAEWGDEWVQIGQDIDGESIDDQSGSFGSVSISSNGNIIIVGGRYNDENGDQTGHVRIYEFIDGTWGQIGEDINGENNGEYFGWSTSMSDNGDIVAVANKSSNGIVKIYENNDGVWEQMGGDIIDDTFIESISLNEDGSIVSIGLYEGYVSVYQYSGDAWNQLGGDILLPESSQNCENSISLNNPGDIIAIGVSQNDDNSSNSGNTKCYSFNGNSWNQLGQDLYGESEGDYSGCSVSLSNSGNILAIGASRNTDNGLDAGHVRVYELINISGNTYEWIQVGMDIDGNSLERSGLAISLNGEGNFVAIGSPGNGTGGNAQGGGVGYVRIYNFIDGSWAQIGENLVGEYSADGSGRSVNLSVDGSTVAIGAPWNYVSELGGSNQFGTNNAGHVRVYEINTPCDTPGCTDPTASNYDPEATEDDGSCVYILDGCTIDQACNFNPEATDDDGSCLFVGESCDDGDETTANDTVLDDCSCSGEAVYGCTYSVACNYNPEATIFDDSCYFVGDPCDDGNADTVNDTYDSNCECVGES
ncbi:hypothetical protein N8134_05130, partial [Flavobacteriales bacterium]|nr:hypothetical protein [Flavobacteriales bacterium]